MLLDNVATMQAGETGERELVRAFLGAGWLVQWTRRTRASRDIGVIAPGPLPLLVEVKNEDAQADTGNICVEIWQSDGNDGRKRSGIMASESNVCVHLLNGKAVLYRAQPMRCWIEPRKGILKQGVYGDNGNMCLLVPRKELAAKPWADEVEIAKVPWSRVWKMSELNYANL